VSFLRIWCIFKIPRNAVRYFMKDNVMTMESGQYDSSAILMNRGLNGGFGFNSGISGGE